MRRTETRTIMTTTRTSSEDVTGRVFAIISQLFQVISLENCIKYPSGKMNTFSSSAYIVFTIVYTIGHFTS